MHNLLIHEGDTVNFEIDLDIRSIRMLTSDLSGPKIGYVNRAFRTTPHRWFQFNHVTATIEKCNGKPERPLVYVMISAN